VIEAELARISLGNEVLVNFIEQKKKEFGEDVFYTNAQRVILQTIDMLWVDQLEQMDYLRSSVGLRSYGQRDPLVEYKKEGLRLFKEMEEAYISNVAHMLEGLGGEVAQKPALAPSVTEVAARGITAGDRGQAHAAKPHGRNDRVVITDGKETQELKYKKAEEMLAKGGWRIVE